MSAQLAAPSRSRLLVEGEFKLTRRCFMHIAAYCRQETGISLPETKAMLVYSRLAKRIRLLGFPNFSTYCSFLESESGNGERAQMLAALTTNVTRFFREPGHFEHLKSRMLPKLAEAAIRGERVRLWSAGCSSGEEAYSMAFTLLDAFPEAPSYDLRILGSDVDTNMIGQAKAGLYSDLSAAMVPAALRERWMTRQSGPDGTRWRVRDEARALVRFRELNLHGAWPMRGRFDVIFCRNVVIYFDDDAQVGLWRRMRDSLTPGGRLYAGHSERVDVDGIVSDGTTIYKLGASEK